MKSQYDRDERDGGHLERRKQYTTRQDGTGCAGSAELGQVTAWYTVQWSTTREEQNKTRVKRNSEDT